MAAATPATPMPDAVILAGGQGLRVGGADKGLLALAGLPLVLHVRKALQPQVASLVISANRNAEIYAGLTGLAVCADEMPDFRGPLAGIAAGFAATRADELLAVPADMPGLPADLVAQLQAARGDAPAVYAEIAGDPVYPLCLLGRALAADLRDTIGRGEYTVRHWLRRHGARGVPIRGWNGPCNLNTPALLAEAERSMDTWSGTRHR